MTIFSNIVFVLAFSYVVCSAAPTTQQTIAVFHISGGACSQDTDFNMCINCANLVECVYGPNGTYPVVAYNTSTYNLATISTYFGDLYGLQILILNYGHFVGTIPTELGMFLLLCFCNLIVRQAVESGVPRND
jgi:hypothetical protein